MAQQPPSNPPQKPSSDGRIVDSLGRVRNLDPEPFSLLMSEFIARALLSRHRCGAIMYGRHFASWQIDTESSSGTCVLSVQCPTMSAVDLVISRLERHEISVVLVETIFDPPEKLFRIKPKPPTNPRPPKSKVDKRE